MNCCTAVVRPQRSSCIPAHSSPVFVLKSNLDEDLNLSWNLLVTIFRYVDFDSGCEPEVSNETRMWLHFISITTSESPSCVTSTESWGRPAWHGLLERSPM